MYALPITRMETTNGGCKAPNLCVPWATSTTATGEPVPVADNGGLSRRAISHDTDLLRRAKKRDRTVEELNGGRSFLTIVNIFGNY